MAITVNAAFTTFNQNVVNLEPDRTTRARASRDWLYDRLENLPNNYGNCPKTYKEKHIKYGSFARNTKIRPLDDIDLIYCLAADNATYQRINSKLCHIYTNNASIRLQNLSDNGLLNSRKVIEAIKGRLQDIEHYSSAEIHRCQEAITLKLNSYEWNFDIVPAFYTVHGFYLIPDGNGNWKPTNPPIDQDRIIAINQKHNGQINQIVRTLKYWNRRVQMPTIPSYLFENIILNYFALQASIDTNLKLNLRNFWHHLQFGIYAPVLDPKGFDGDLNLLPLADKDKIATKALEAYQKACDAITFELNYDQKSAIEKWREIFGPEFPNYE
ncbi:MULTISPECIES: SMODS domain-containing nucleotidyltransferase [Alistipes]|jgi:hypothetical protein|uniref:SMODS domain-containing nucleotidyltransferase n=1 Tax=Alistipes TaxID=239759 RepID=UPI000AF563D6|nr:MULTISPECIES: nucleotidyltransferase [Alistipes]MBV4295873.1 hypothetical protein [Alistipes shahii]